MAGDSNQALAINGGAQGAAGRVHDYRAYGLNIRSELLLPELDPAIFKAPDVSIRVRPTGGSIENLRVTDFRYELDRQYLAWPQVGSYVIHGASVIDVEPASTANDQMARMPLLGPVMALLLHLRGMLVLHASAIGVGDQAVVFMGDKGAGKSTTAAAMIAAGHPLLTDDVVAIDFTRPGDPHIAPGFPQMKLDPDLTGGEAFKHALTLPEPVENFPKTLLRLTGDFSHAPVPPTRICVLVRGDKAEMTRLSPAEALSSLVRFSYTNRFAERPATREDAATQLRQAAALASAGRVWRLEAPTGVERLPELVALIERELGFTPQGAA